MKDQEFEITESNEAQAAINQMKLSPIEILSLNVRCAHYLQQLGITTVGELTARKDLEHPTLYLNNSKTVRGVIEALAGKGLTLNMTDEDWASWAKIWT